MHGGKIGESYTKGEKAIGGHGHAGARGGFRLGYQPQPLCQFRVGFKIPISTSRFKPEELIPPPPRVPTSARKVLKKTAANSPIINRHADLRANLPGSLTS